jgi:hypothetical protein
VVPAAEQLRELADRLNAARTVTLFCGAGVRDAHAEVMALADRLASPIGHSLRGKEWIQFDNPYDVGMTGLLGYGACYDAMHEADLLLLGTDFPYDAFLPQRRTVQVDHDRSRLGRRTPLGGVCWLSFGEFTVHQHARCGSPLYGGVQAESSRFCALPTQRNCDVSWWAARDSNHGRSPQFREVTGEVEECERSAGVWR